MRAWLLVCAALALAPRRATAAHPSPHPRDPLASPRTERIKSLILAKLGLTERPMPLGAPPRDVVRQILARATDPVMPEHEAEHAMREVIAIAHRGLPTGLPILEQVEHRKLLLSILPSLTQTECSTACKGNPANPGFAANTKYNYGVEGTVNIFLTGSSEKETSVKLLGQVSVTTLGDCGHELTVQNLVISGPDGKKYQSPPGIEKPVRFSLQDGRLAAEICTVEGDTRRSLNIKRAIISLLQTEQKSTTQVDIFGACPTEIAYSAEGGATLVHRTRDLARCAHREQGKNDLIASVLNENAEIKESQVLQSTLHVESKVNNGVPEKVSASEEYLYKPFSVGENGARARVHTKLVLTGKSGGAAAASQCTVPRSVIFEAPHGAPLQNNVNSALAAVKDTAKAINNEATEKSAGNFAALIRIFRVTSKDDLIKVWNQVKGNNFEKRVYLDALLRTGTGASIEASIQILKSHGLNELEQQLVYLSLGNAKHVNDEALKAATGLLDQHNLPKEIYLGVGALAGAYCRSHQCHTTKSDGIVALSQKLGAKLQNCKPKTKVEEDNVVAVLKGIRSIRHLEDSLIEKLVHCVNDHNVKARVKAAALEAFGADPCSAKLKKTALDIMKNRQLDSEIRIKGYLAVIACPCARSANEIKTLLDSEPIHQVGRYITSSLRAIRASSSPDKQLARQHYALISTPNKFNVDDRKYSFYRESSFNVDALGVGGAVEQSVIYSQNSFLPRSASLNLTTEIFGHSFNVLELGGRQGNLDLVVEHFLGPKGILKTKGPQAIYDILAQAFAQSSEKVKSALNRGRRSVKSEIDGFDKSLKAEELHFDNELDLDIYVKLFGTDAVFLSLGDDKGFDYNKVLDKIMNAITGGIGKAQHMSTELRTHLLFLDAELSYPTSIGVPLRLDLTGAATARIDLSTNFDLKQCISNPQNAKIDIKFIPSSDIEITGTLIVDADAIATGLKVVTNLHSSTGGHLVAKVLENGNGLDLQLGLPVEKQEIIVASNDLVYITVEKGQKEKQIKINIDGEKKEYAGCFDQLSGLLGMTLCGQVTLPFSVSGPEAQASISKYLARFPLSGQSQLKLVLEKNDLKGYHVRGLVKNENGKATLDLLFEAEGSKNRRTQIIAERIYTSTEVGVKLSLNSPIKNMAGEFSLRNSPSELTAMAKANVDNDQYYGRVGFNVAGNEQRMTYKPIFEYQLPGDQKHTVQIDGQVLKAVDGPNIKYQFEGISIKLPSSQEPIAIQGFYSYQTNARNVQWNLISDFTTIKGSLKNSDIELEFFNKLNPLVNFILKGHSEFGDVIKNEFDVIYSGDCKDQSRRLVFGQFLKYQKSDKDFNVITKNKLEIVTIPFKVSFDADLDPKKVEVEFQFKNVDQKADLELKARTQIKRPEDYSIKLNSNVNKHGIEIFSKRDVINNDKSNLQNYIVIKGVGKYELSGVVLHKTLPNDVNVGAIGHLKITGKKSEDIKFDIGAIQTATLYSSHAKVSSSQGELVDYLLKINTATNANGQLKFNLKDTITANGQFQVTDANGKGNGMLIVDFKKSQRKIKGDVKFQAKKPVFNGDFDIYLNWEKDNKDKISFSTNTKQTDKSLDSKNKLEYAGKNTELNVNLNGELAVSGKSHANVEVVLPTERCLTLKYNRDVNEKSGVYNGNVNMQVSDAPKRGAGGSSISYTGKVVNSNLDKAIIDYAGELDFKLIDGKQLKNAFSLKNQPQGNEMFKFDFKNEVTGNVLPKPASVDISCTYLDSLMAEDDVYRLKAAYGDDTSIDISGKWIIKFPEKGEKKYLDDFTVNVRLPFEKAHDIKWVSTVLYLLPENKDVSEYTVIESVQINADVWKVDANGKVGVRQGSGTVKVLVPHVDPVILDASYKTDDSHDKKALFTEVKAKYGKGKSATFSVDTSGTANGNSVSIKANAPHLEKMKKLEISVISKHPAPDTYSSSWIIDADGRVYKSESTIVLSKAHPILDLKYTSPTNGKTSRIYVKGSSLSSTQGKVEVKIDNVRDISLDAISEASVQKDNVNFKVQANSKELGWDNFVGEIASKDAGNGKRLEFHSTNGNKNVLSGSTSFISKQEGQKTIIEGSGSVKIKEEQKSANFKYIRTILTEGNEKGVETFFNVAFGERSYVAESRVTNLEYKNSHVYCEEKKQCANAELQSKIDVSKPGVIANVVSAGLDLRILGITPELGLIVRDEVSTSRLPQYTLDLHANKDSRKYHLHVYSTPEFGLSKAGVKIQLPSRVMILEQSVAYPTDKPLPFPIKGELVLDLNKNKPGHKAAARFLVDLEVGSSDRQTAVAEFGFSHPKIDKEALIRISGAAVRHGENNFKIETTAKISHSSLGKDRESKILFEVSPTHFVFVINTPIVKIIDVTASAAIKDKLQKADVKFVLLEGKPVQAEFLVKDFQYYEFTTAAPDRKLSVIGHIEPEKRVDITADIVLGGQKKNLAHGALWLENNQVKSDYGANKDNLNYFYKALRKDLDDLEGRVKEIGEKAGNDLKEVSRRIQPTLQKLEQAYEQDLKQIYQEIADDKVLKDISQAFHDIAKYVAKIIDEVVTGTKPIIDNITALVSDLAKKIQELYEKQIEPSIKQFYATIANGIKTYLDSVIDVVAHFAAFVTDFFEKHKAELQELTNTIAEIFKDITRLIVAELKEYRAKLTQIFTEFTEWLKDLPILQVIKEKWSELAVPEQALGFAQQAHDTIRPLLPTPEAQAFADSLNEYVLKKLRKDKIDDSKELRVVYQKLVNAVASLIQYVRAQLNQYGVVPTGPQVTSWWNWNPVNTGSAPTFGGSASFSALKQLLTGDFPDVTAIVNAYRPRSLDPLQQVPSPLRAVVVNGQHIFTFDGRHLTFPGSCRYVLAHDYVDRNFTLLLQMADGKPKALVLEDKNGAVIELKENGQATLNGANHGFPVEEKDSFAFRQANGRVGLGTLYGLMAFCSPKLEVCYFEVNGFYLGKLRGLLGDGNNEPYDDFRLPNGKISTSESEFGNAYRLARSCPQVQVPEHSHHQLHHAPLPADCEKVFGGSSPLRALSLVLDIAPFRQACIHAVAGASAPLQQACQLGAGYAALAVSGLLPAVMPEDCMTCTDADKPRSIGDSYEFKLPNKQADIVISVETTKVNEKTFKEMVVPLVSQVIDQLKSKRCADIKVYLVGITSRFPYPVMYDTDLKLKNAKITFTDESRYDYITPIKTGGEKVDRAIDQFVSILNGLKTHFGIMTIEASYAQLYEIPLRPGAVKHSIMVVGEHCEPANFILEAFAAAVHDTIRENNAITHSLISIVDGLVVGNGKNAQQVVGFNKNAVLMLGDKKPGKDAEALRATLEVSPDSCIYSIEEVAGTIFSSTNYFALNAGQQKQFLQTASGAISHAMLHETLVQECTCTYSDPFSARSVCINKDRKEVARRRK